jgi:hypothetical protein
VILIEISVKLGDREGMKENRGRGEWKAETINLEFVEHYT